MKGNEISGKELRADSVSKSVENYIRESRIYNPFAGVAEQVSEPAEETSPDIFRASPDRLKSGLS